MTTGKVEVKWLQKLESQERRNNWILIELNLEILRKGDDLKFARWIRKISK